MKRSCRKNNVKTGFIISVILFALCPGFSFSADLQPAAAPAPTMHTMKEIYDMIILMDGGIPKSGQVLADSLNVWDDGYRKKGLAWPLPRFTDNQDGTVTDNITDLVWLKNANCLGAAGNWDGANSFANSLASGNCGLSDDSTAGDWRLPNVRELISLLHFGYTGPALPNTAGNGQFTTSGEPFTNVASNYYWSRTIQVSNNTHAFAINLDDGLMDMPEKLTLHLAWPVRDK